MSSIANLVAFDGAGTPVSHTLLPISVVDDKSFVEALYRESASGVPVYGQITARIRQFPRTKTGIYRSVIQVDVPVMEAVNNQNSAGYTAAPKVAHVISTRVEQLAHERSDINIRRLARQLAINIAGGVVTTVAPVTTGPGPELVDQLVLPT